MSRCGLSDHPDGGAEVGAAEDERRRIGSIFPVTQRLFCLLVFLIVKTTVFMDWINNGNN